MFKIIIKFIKYLINLDKMEILTVKNIAQSCTNILQKYNGRPEKGKICMISLQEFLLQKFWFMQLFWKSFSGNIHEVGFEDYSLV